MKAREHQDRVVQEEGGNNACSQNDGRNGQIPGAQRGAGGGDAVRDAAAGESGCFLS